MESTVQERKNNGVEETETDMQPHILLLHKYFGEQLANHFLDPSYQFPLSPVQPLLPEIVGQNAKDYWRLLREHSEARLIKDITNVPGTLMRSTFTQLPPSKLLNQIHHFRKTIKVMCRTSEMNQDRAMLIMANNSLFNLRGEEMIGSPVQYLSKEDCLLRKKSRIPGKPLQLPLLNATNSFTRDESVGNLITVTPTQKRFRFLTEETSNDFKSECLKRFNERKEKKQTLDVKYIYNMTTFNHLPNINYNENESHCRSMPVCTGKNVAESITCKALMDYRPSRIQSRKEDIGQNHTQWLLKKHFH